MKRHFAFTFCLTFDFRLLNLQQVSNLNPAMRLPAKRIAYIIASLAVISCYSLNKLERRLAQKKSAHLELPPEFTHLIDLEEYFRDDFDKTRASVLPLYWHIAKAAGTTVHSFYSQCYRLIEASEIGGFASSDKLEIVEKNRVKNHLNVDVSTLEGINHARDVGLAESRLADIIVSPLFYASTKEIFSEDHRGVMFSMFRHPIKRILSLFYYLQHSTWEMTYNPIFANMTLEEYSSSDFAESNYITRSLVNKMEGPLMPDDFELAKIIIRKKCLVGLVDEFETSIRFFNEVFGFRPNFDAEVVGEESASEEDKKVHIDQCLEDLRTGKGAGSNRHKHEDVSEDSVAYNTLALKNGYDLQLWDLIVEKYKEQQLVFKGSMDRSTT